MEKFDEHEINYDQRDEATSKGEFGEIIRGLPFISMKNYPPHFPINKEIYKVFEMFDNDYDVFDNVYDVMQKKMCPDVATDMEQALKLVVGDSLTHMDKETFKESRLPLLSHHDLPILSHLIVNKMFKGFCKQIKKESHSPYGAIEIDEENGYPYMTQNQFTIHKKHPEQHDFTIWATFYTGQLGIACCLGNPFDMFSKLKGTGKVKEQSLLSFGEALPVFLPSMTLSAMFFLNFIYTTILTRPLPFRVPANSILLLLLFYYIMALAEAMSGSGVLWGSVQISALSFVSGGAIGLMMLIGSIIMMVKFYFKRSFSLN
ncbi:hypothetical protein PHAVU_010G045000 [Phaseolus vulgaris]|uniref:Uncharacterized protein n=1 Tax=Phaseolus vulgaris TaxID=3885 RepID=V7ALC5_PHAVU|nr:hypothetical protein PHAVU_010G045000g [Phaseolus vulgaris]ESW06397.1 hypothetical protein PHAVU_010G045000g [Phaseolus vulgaris]